MKQKYIRLGEPIPQTWPDLKVGVLYHQSTLGERKMNEAAGEPIDRYLVYTSGMIAATFTTTVNNERIRMYWYRFPDGTSRKEMTAQVLVLLDLLRVAGVRVADEARYGGFA